jgi:hypothetical protein
MPTTHATDFGVVQFMPVESFADPYHGLDKEALDERFRDLLEERPLKAQSVADWPRVHVAIRRSGLFVIETETPAFTARLSFCPEQPDAGDYEIHHRPRGGVEKGRTVKAAAVATDAEHPFLSMLTPFPTRYTVVTVGSARPHARMIWLVGLRDFRSVDETDEADEPVA